MQIREGGSYIRDPETGELRPNMPADELAPVITAPEGKPTPAGEPAGGDETPAEATRDEPAAARRRTKKGD